MQGHDSHQINNSIHIPHHCKKFKPLSGGDFEQLLQKSLFLAHAVVAELFLEPKVL